MFPRVDRGGLRPAHPAALSLPPTLQPHAIHAMAPAPDRRTSLAFAGLVYLSLMGGVIGLAHMKGQVLQVTHDPLGPEKIYEPQKVVDVKLALTPPAHVAVPKGTGTRPPDAPTYDPSQALIPDQVPTNLPTENRSQAFNANLPIGKPGEVATGGDPNGSDKVPVAGSGPVSIDMSAVHVLQQVTPVYPPLAKMSHLQGDVVLRMVIDPAGHPLSVDVVSGPPQFQAEALRAARLWRFTPARINGEAVAAAFNLTLQFRLR
ncbi:MAG TPA: TonB family protein [Holophagaceae bacterium]|nr:TonB family protein [Holophagaceae bacterium]